MVNVQSARNIDSALRKKGFQCVLEKDHVFYYFLRRNGERTSIKTKISHGMGNSDIGSPLIAQMSRQLRLTKQQFLDFVDCTISEEDYRSILRDLGIQ